MKHYMSSLIGVLVFTALITSAVTGDTIYLKNGMKFRAYILEQTEEKITFVKNGGKISIAMNQVEDIQKDNFGKIDEEVAEQMAREAERTRSRESTREDGETRKDGDSQAAAKSTWMKPRGKEDKPDEAATKAYWQKLKKELEQKIESRKSQLTRLEKERRGLARNFINTTEIREQIEDLKKELADLEAEYRALPDKARKEGVPPGWLR